MSERPLVARTRHGYELRLGADERGLVVRLLGELREVIAAGGGDGAAYRLFPVVHPDDPEAEAEYQGLMRDELIESRLAGVDRVVTTLEQGGRKVTFDEDGLTSFMQSVNSLRLVLGTMLGIDEDDALTEDSPPELHLYAFLSWILDEAVRAVE